MTKCIICVKCGGTGKAKLSKKLNDTWLLLSDDWLLTSQISSIAVTKRVEVNRTALINRLTFLVDRGLAEVRPGSGHNFEWRRK